MSLHVIGRFHIRAILQIIIEKGTVASLESASKEAHRESNGVTLRRHLFKAQMG